jgi:hypothetical protein
MSWSRADASVISIGSYRFEVRKKEHKNVNDLALSNRLSMFSTNTEIPEEKRGDEMRGREGKGMTETDLRQCKSSSANLLRNARCGTCKSTIESSQ